MRILFEVVDPADVHFFKQTIRILREQGHEILVSARDKDIALELLNKEEIPYKCLSKSGAGLIGLAGELIARQFKMFQLLRQWKPDAVVAKNAGPAIGLTGFLLRVPRVVQEDTEHAKLQRMLGLPFATVIVTFDGYLKDHGHRQRKYRGIWPQAYLDPKYFTPQKEPLFKAGVNPDEPYIVLRTVAWEAAHDAGHAGVSEQVLLEAVERLKPFGRVLISSERPLPDSLRQYANPVAVEDIHHLLAYAQFYMGEGGTMAAEAAVLGVPAIFTSVLECGYLVTLEEQYKMAYNRKTMKEGIDLAASLLSQPDLKEQWREKHKAMLEQSDDISQVMADVIIQTACKKK